MTFLNKILAPVFCLVAFVAFGQKEAQKITIGESITLESNILNETRTINIYLPPTTNRMTPLNTLWCIF
ncbi:hypothetical protein QNH98_11085 [Myroides sp. mNGS23_01]|nr:hypothetical protein [Myroides sp. mNGS23_01]WHT37714.1 hypothetical protein QNH98_11085 [Myroides sp. mNGS23_01]